MNRIQKLLFENQDVEYKAFTEKLIPNIPKDSIIGVRLPKIREMAKELSLEDGNKLISDLPHKYHEEYQLHSFYISKNKNYEEALSKVKELLPYINNWAVCDSLNPKVFSKNLSKLIKEIPFFLKSKNTYTIRFGISMLMRYYLDDLFEDKYLLWVSRIKSDEYYVNMMIAWYFATALAKQYDSTIIYFKEHKLSPWVHNKALQKARESFRIDEKAKEYLNSLKV